MADTTTLPLKGEVTFEALDRRWSIVLDFNALCAVESELAIPMTEIGQVIGSSAVTIRSLFRIGLSARHGSMTDLEAGRVIGEIGVKRAAEIIGEAFLAAFPDVATSAEGNAQAEEATKPAGQRKKR